MKYNETLTKNSTITNLSLMVNKAVLFLKEPGKSVTIETVNSASAKTQSLLVPGAEIEFKIKGGSYWLTLGNEVISQLEEGNFIQKIKYALSKGFPIQFYLVKRSKQTLAILARCDKAIFLNKNQPEMKPFTKHEEVLEEGLRREPEMSGEEESDSPNANMGNISEESSSEEKSS